VSDDNQKLWRLLAQAINGETTSLEGFDDSTLSENISRHGIGPLLHHRKRQGTLLGVSDALAEQIAATARAQAALDLLLNDNTRKFVNLLSNRKIPALLLKGTPVAHLYYPQTWLRPRCDTDVYIREQDVESTMAVLREHGYEIGGQLHRKYSSRQFVAYVKASQRVASSFDVHWKLSNRVLFWNTLPFEECYENRQPVPALGEHAWTLSTADLLLHACIHRIGHGRGIERNRMLWLYDIDRILRAMTPEERTHFQEKAIVRKVGILCADALEVSGELFGTEGAEPLAKQLRVNYRGEPTAKLVNASKLRWAWADLMALKGVKEKAAFARELLGL